jgi:hypothetical protein
MDATQKVTAIDQQQHSHETLISQCHQTILRFPSTAATASTRWQVRELYCQNSYSSSFCTMCKYTVSPGFEKQILPTLFILRRPSLHRLGTDHAERHRSQQCPLLLRVYSFPRYVFNTLLPISGRFFNDYLHFILLNFFVPVRTALFHVDI